MAVSKVSHILATLRAGIDATATHNHIPNGVDAKCRICEWRAAAQLALDDYADE